LAVIYDFALEQRTVSEGGLPRPLLAGSDKSLNGRFASADCRKGLHTSRHGSRWSVWSGDRSQSHRAV